MKADLTRNTFHPFKHFTRVLMQQGRVQLDSDWNEQAAILLRYMRALAADLIGPQGGPRNNYGFALSALPGTPAITTNFQIGRGHYYVDGILCEADSEPVAVVVQSGNVVQVEQWALDYQPFLSNQWVEVFDDVQPPSTPAFNPTVVQSTNPVEEKLTLTLQGAPANLSSAANPKLRRVFTYLTQPDYPVPNEEKLVTATYLIYLDVWERHITYVEDDSIREVALGGPDTATRAKVVWQVKAIAGTQSIDAKRPCDHFNPTDPNFLNFLLDANRGLLKARANQKSISTDPCIIAPDASYRGAENQLYRVEIHRPGNAWNGTDDPSTTTAATFKWSRENGSVVFPIVSIASGSGTTTVVLENLGRDDRFSLTEGDWVEIQNDDYVLQNHAGSLLNVQSIDRSTLKVTLSGSPDPSIGTDTTKHPLLRRWEQRQGDPAEGGLTLGSDGAALIEESVDTWLNLEDGVQIQFEPPEASSTAGATPRMNRYRTVDYWLIPARTATGDVEWPTETTKDSQGNTVVVRIAKPPDGIDHHYAPLGVINVSPNGVTPVTPDCRKQFSPLAQ
jgi:hypothetical protein